MPLIFKLLISLSIPCVSFFCYYIAKLLDIIAKLETTIHQLDEKNTLLEASKLASEKTNALLITSLNSNEAIPVIETSNQISDLDPTLNFLYYFLCLTFYYVAHKDLPEVFEILNNNGLPAEIVNNNGLPAEIMNNNGLPPEVILYVVHVVLDAARALF